MSADPREISFTPVAAEHFPLLSTWLARPHIREWWGDPQSELGHIRDMVDGRDSTRPFLIVEAGVPVGYIQCWFLGHPQNAIWLRDNPWLGELPKDTVGVDLSIGEPDRLSAGVGSAALRAFVAMLRRQGHRTIVIDPDPNNPRAVRAYEKAGFRAIPELLGKSGDALIMRHHADMETAA